MKLEIEELFDRVRETSSPVTVAASEGGSRVMKVVSIIPKADLSKDQALRLEQRRSAPEHRNDIGPSHVWHHYNNGTLYGVFEKGSGQPVGVADASGEYYALNAGWWADSRLRGQGYGSALVEALADYLIAKGYRGVGPIRIDTFGGEYQLASSNLKKRFRSRFHST